MNNDFIQELKEKRKRYGVSQSRLAVACGISREYYNRIENGKTQFTEALKEELKKQIERFNPEEPLFLLIEYIRATQKWREEGPMYYSNTGGVRGDEGTYFIYTGIERLVQGLERDTTLADLIEQTGLEGKYGVVDADGTIPAYYFEKEGYGYRIQFDTVKLEDGEADSEEKIRERIQYERLLNNWVEVMVAPPLAKEVTVYDNVSINFFGMDGERLDSCMVPSAGLWHDVIKMEKSMMLYVHGPGTLSFEFQAEPSEATGTITISCGSQKKEQAIHTGVNSISFSWDEYMNGVGITITGPEGIYIRDAVLSYRSGNVT